MRIAAAVLLASALAACGDPAVGTLLVAEAGETLHYRRDLMLHAGAEVELMVAQDVTVSVVTANDDELVLNIACDRAQVWLGPLEDASALATPDFDSDVRSAEETLRDSDDLGEVYAATWGDAAMVSARVVVGHDAAVRGVEVLSGKAETGDDEMDPAHAALASLLSDLDDMIVGEARDAGSLAFFGLGPKVTGDLQPSDTQYDDMPGVRVWEGSGSANGPDGAQPANLRLVVGGDERGWATSLSFQMWLTGQENAQPVLAGGWMRQDP